MYTKSNTNLPQEISDIKLALDESSIIAMTDSTGKITYVNDKFCDISKYDEKELLGQDHRIINSGYHPKKFFKDLWKTIASGKVWKGQIKNKAKDGSYYWVATTIVPFLDESGRPYQYVSIRTDITEQKRVEEELWNSQQLFVGGPTVIFKRENKKRLPVEFVTNNVEQFGYSSTDFMNRNLSFEDIIFKEDLDQVKSELNAFNDSSERELETDYRIITGDGEIRWVHDYTKVLRNHQGIVTHYYGYLLDVTDRRMLEKELIRSLGELSDIKHALDESSIVAITDQKGTITYVNDMFCEISKYDRDELIGQNHRILNSGFHQKDFFKNMWKTIGSGEIWKGEIRNKAKDGSFYWVFTTIVPFLDSNGKPYQYVSIRNDITERKKSEEMLKTLDKLSVVGELAAGIAHEIRNPLTTIKGLLEFELEDNYDNENLQIILEEVDRINFIVSEFMSLAKPKGHEYKKKNLITMLNQVVSFVKPETRKKNVQLITNFNYDELLILCEENQIKQVVINLIKNAIEAMPKGGNITLDIQIKENNIYLSITDEGVGIPEEKIKKLGEPFFTTKEQGNGLGLMVSFKIIESHNGKVQVKSELNKGTTFTIILPIASEK